MEAHIKTKYEVGQKLYFVEGAAVKTATIDALTVKTQITPERRFFQKIEYTVGVSCRGSLTLDEEKIGQKYFTSKVDMIRTLAEQIVED